jgi:hypothetical protein
MYCSTANMTRRNCGSYQDNVDGSGQRAHHFLQHVLRGTSSNVRAMGSCSRFSRKITPQQKAVFFPIARILCAILDEFK